MDWDDYRYFAAVVEYGSVRGAAQSLGVNASTVTRRLDQLESDLGVALFIRTNKGLTITTEGVEVAQRTDEIATQFRLMDDAVRGRDQRIAGRVRVVMPDILATRLLLPELSVFTELYPDIDLELIPGYQSLDPQRLVTDIRTDIVVRATDNPPEAMIGRHIGSVALAAYASVSFAESRGLERPWDDLREASTLPWVEWTGEGEVARRYVQLKEQYFPGVKVAIRCDQIEMQRAAILAGIGMGILPCMVGNPDSRLVRLEQMPVVAAPDLWILTHPASRPVRRVQLFLAFLRDLLVGHARTLAEGIASDSAT